MAQSLIEQAVLFHSIIQQKFNLNYLRLSQLKKFSSQTINVFDSFSKNIIITLKQHFKNLKNDQEQDQNIIFLNKYLIDIMQEFGKKIVKMTNNIKNQIIQPLNEFIQNQTLTNKIILNQSQANIYTLQNNSEYLKQLSKNYEFNIKQPSTLKQQKAQYTQIYHLEIQKCNQKWYQIKQNYHQILNKIDTFNSSRINFTMKQQIKIIRIINQEIVKNQNIQEVLKQYEELNIQNNYNLNNSGNINYNVNNIQNNQNNSQKITEINEIWKQNKSLSILIKDQIRQKIGKLNLLEQNTHENNEQLQKWLSNNSDKISTNSNQKRIVDNFVSIFTSKSNLKQQSKDFQQARTLILDKIQWIKYFLNKMQSSLHTQINLPIVKYRQLTALIKYIFAHAADIQQENQPVLLYGILFISYRIKYNQDYLIKDLGKQNQFWKNEKVWFKILEYIKKNKYSYKKIQGNILNNNINNLNINNYNLKENNSGEEELSPTDYSNLNPLNYLKYGGKIIIRDFWLRKNPRKNMVKNIKQKSQKLLLDARDYDIMCQLNYFMIKLELQEKFVFNFILQTRKRYNLSDQNVRKLIKTHYFSRITITNKIGSSQIKRKKRLEKKYNQFHDIEAKLCWAIGKSLKYLKLSDNITSLRLINKYFSENLTRRIYERYLIHQNNLTHKTRITLYKQICRAPYSQKVYYKMVKQMPQVSDNTQIIYLDAKRSMAWNQDLRINLMQVLGVYSFYHPQVGYLQGMNYLCENILKLTSNNYYVYQIFEYLMNIHFNNMYTGKFDGLKIKIYQTMRILQLLNKSLYTHLETQKIEGQHFLLSWAITLWGQMSGDLCWILWDGFVIKGWKWFIKTCLWLLKHLQLFLLSMNFQQIMKCFSELSTSLFCLKSNQLSEYGIDIKNIKKQINQIHIESQILKDIEKQYQTKINTINEYLKKLEQKKTK